jgi:translocation and assembly module TamA
LGIRKTVWLLLAVSCATQKNDAPVVHSLKLMGTHAVSASTIKDKILTAATSWIPFTSKQHFDPLVWEADLRRIKRVYEAAGYHRAQITAAQVLQRKGNEVDLVVKIEEGPPTVVASLQTTGIDVLPEDQQFTVLKKLPLTAKSTFTEPGWNDTKSDVQSRLRGLGYAEARLQGQALVDLATSQARLSLLATPGLRYRFGDITVRQSPGSRVPGWMVQEQVHLALDDSYFSEELLDEAQRLVFAMGTFSTARVTIGRGDRDTGRVPVTVQLREAPFRTLKLGGGAGIDAIRQEVHLISEWTNRDFLGGLRRLTLQGTVGWAFLPTVWDVIGKSSGASNGPIFKVQADFEQPRFLGRPSLRLKDLIESERTVEQDYTAIGGRTGHGVAWQPSSSLTIYPSYQLQGYRLNTGAVPTSTQITAAPLALGCPSAPCFVLLSYLEQDITWDRRDDRLEPRRGHYLALTLQEGGGPLQGDYTYLRIAPEGRGYLSFGESRRTTLAARLSVGTLINKNGVDPSSGEQKDSAVVVRFMAGGANSMRGFSLRRLSPLLLAQNVNSRNALYAFPIGGDGDIEGNLEVRRAITQNFTVAGFLDFGTVTREALAPSALATLQWAVGFGLRYLTPVGPIRVDIGVRLPFGRPPPLYTLVVDEKGHQHTVEISYSTGLYDRVDPTMPPPGSRMYPVPETGANVNKSCFGIGGNNKSTWVTDGLCAFHISIGEAF